MRMDNFEVSGVLTTLLILTVFMFSLVGVLSTIYWICRWMW